MATKRTTLKIESKGGEKVERDLKKIGAVAETTGRKVESGSKKAGKGLKALDASVARTNASMRRMADNLGPVGAGLSKLGTAGLAAGVGLAAVTAGLVKIVRVGEAAERQNFKIAALLETTGQSSGQTAESIDKIARSIADLTLASTGGVREAAAALLTFKSVSGDAFERTLRVSQDLAAVMGKDLKSAVLQLGKALEDPQRNLSALNESGISFSQNQIDVIKRLAETGQEAEALSEILGQIEGQVGGAGAAEAGGIAGGFDSIRESLTFFLEEVGKGTGIVSGFSDAIKFLSEGVKNVNEAIFPDLDIRRIDALQAVLDATRELKGGDTLAATESKIALEAAKKQLAVIDDLRAARDSERKAAEENARIQAQLRIDERESAEARKVAVKADAEAEKKRAATAKKTAADREKALADIARLEEKARKAGLDQLQLLTFERDKELEKQKTRHEQGLINEQEFSDARLAIEKDYQAEKADIAEKATKKVSAEAKEQATVFVSTFSNAAKGIQSAFADTFTDIFRNGVTRFEDLTDAMRDIAARTAGEIAALWVFRPSVASGLFGAAGVSGAGTAGATGIGGLLAGGGLGLGATLGLTAGGILGGTALSGGFGSRGGTLGGIAGGGLGAYGGLLLGSSTALGPLGIPIGALLGSLLGGGIGSLFGGGGNDKQKFGFSTGSGGLQTPFGGLSVTSSKNVDAGAIVRSLANIDESIASLLSPGQIERVRGGLAGTSQRFDVKSFDNESFDVVKTRLVRIIDAVAENTVASGLLNSIGRDPGNIDQLVASAGSIIEMINAFQDQGADLNNAEQAVAALNEQFDTIATNAENLGFAITDVETKRQQALVDLTADFNTSIRDQILSIEEPLTLALENVERSAQERLDNARTLGVELVEVERLNALERAKVIDQAFGGANSSITRFLDSLKITGAGGLSVSQQTANAERQFTSLLGAARTDPTARADLSSLLPTLLDLKREQLGSTSSFFEFTTFLDTTLRNLVDQGDTVSTLQDIGSAITAGDNAIVDALREEIGSLRVSIEQQQDTINLLLNAPAVA